MVSRPWVGVHELGAGVHQEEVAGPVRVLGVALVQAHLADHRGVLVAEHPTDDDLTVERGAGGAELLGVGRRHDLGQHLPRDVEQLQQLVVPAQLGQVHQHGPAGVGHVGQVPTAVGAAGQVPQQPGVDGAEQRVAGLGRGAQTVHLGQQPGELAAGEVGGRRDAGPFPDQVARARPVQVADQLGGAGVLPDDGVVVRLTGPPVPHDRGLALVGDADRGDVGGADPARRHRLLDDRLGPLPDLQRVVLDPAGTGHDLVVLDLVGADRGPARSKMMHRVLVVPWSIAATRSAIPRSLPQPG